MIESRCGGVWLDCIMQPAASSQAQTETNGCTAVLVGVLCCLVL
jgi:hypothetical protein